METETRIHLAPSFFPAHETPLVKSGPLTAFAFRFPSGVEALRLCNQVGQLVMLPFQGQQVWSARFHDRDLTMRSMFDQPQPNVPFLQTFGGFAVHCGATAMGGPGPEDTHPLHGELPNAPYQSAVLLLGQDEKGAYIGLEGHYHHQAFFSANYLAQPVVRLYAGSTCFDLDMTITNLKRTAMELMYLAHVNFCPVDDARLVYSAPCTPQHVRVRANLPAHVRPCPGYVEFVKELKKHPERHHHLRPGLAFDPEVVFFIDYLADQEGWAHSMQIHPSGSADYIAHRPRQLPRATRWISRTPDQDAIAIVEPGTAEPEGYTAEKNTGNIHTLAPQEQFHCQLRIGSLPPSQAEQMANRIDQIVQGAR